MSEPPQDDRWRTPDQPEQPPTGGPQQPTGPPSFEKRPDDPPPSPYAQPGQYPPGQFPPPGQPYPSQPQHGQPQGQYPPPGQFAQYPGQYQPPPPVLRPVRALGSVVVVLAAVVTGGELLSGLTGFGYSAYTWSAYDTLTSLTSLVWLASFVVTGIWLTRIRRNSELLAPTFHHKRRWGWAWAGWLVPVVSFWFPFQVVRDAVTASASAGDPAAPRPPRPPFALWWGTWLAGLALTNAASQQTTSDYLSSGSTIGPLHLLGALCLGASLYAWIKIVRTAVALQQAAG